jgi:hypothetical protein
MGKGHANSASSPQEADGGKIYDRSDQSQERWLREIVQQRGAAAREAPEGVSCQAPRALRSVDHDGHL